MRMGKKLLPCFEPRSGPVCKYPGRRLRDNERELLAHALRIHEPNIGKLAGLYGLSAGEALEIPLTDEGKEIVSQYAAVEAAELGEQRVLVKSNVRVAREKVAAILGGEIEVEAKDLVRVVIDTQDRAGDGIGMKTSRTQVDTRNESYNFDVQMTVELCHQVERDMGDVLDIDTGNEK